jgi:hypothetical protein
MLLHLGHASAIPHLNGAPKKNGGKQIAPTHLVLSTPQYTSILTSLHVPEKHCFNTPQSLLQSESDVHVCATAAHSNNANSKKDR